MKKRRVHVFISGRVQGVCFRAYARDAAKRTGVYGWVRNMRDGRVETVFEGDEENVRNMLEWCNEGGPIGRVDSVEVREEVFTDEFTSFNIVH